MYIFIVRFLSYIKRGKKMIIGGIVSNNLLFLCILCSDKKKLNLLKVKWKNRSFKTYLLKSYQISNIKYVSSRKVQLKFVAMDTV